MKRSEFTIPQALLLIGGLSLVAFVLGSSLPREGNPGRIVLCSTNLRQWGIAISQYTQDHNDRMPPLALHPLALAQSKSLDYGWADAIWPYIKSVQVYRCPVLMKSDPRGYQPWQAGYTDYYLNGRIAGMRTIKLVAPSQSVMLGEGNDGIDVNDARYSHVSVPAAWPPDGRSPANRHNDGANYLFADGHTKWLQYDHVPGLGAPKSGVFTFRP